MGSVLSWPCREPGRPYRWVLSLDSQKPAPTCLTHRLPCDGLGVCVDCLADWRERLGADPDEWIECLVCGYPLHPAVEAGGFETCPTCDPRVEAYLSAAESDSEEKFDPADALVG